ncbi:MAG: YgjV family protein [Oscillospiraceae bacterium]|nr:YgjV family protein [Oscillospiraceae bacterium]
MIGNAISLAAAGFMASSCLVKNSRAIFICQFLECVLLAVSSVFFGSLAGTAVLAVSALRNLLVAAGRYPKKLMYLFVLATAVLGIWVNTKGLIGLLPVAATVEYTVCCYYIKGLKATRYSIFINVAIWVIYSFCIFDFSTALTDSAVLLVDAAAIVKLYRREKREKAPEGTGPLPQ